MEESFARQVASLMKRPTDGERRAIRAELEAHVEDHAGALTAGGFSPEEARERAEEAMGDPRETAEALDAQLSPLWLWVGRLFKAAAILLAILALYTVGVRVYQAYRWSAIQRDPERYGVTAIEGYVCQGVDVSTKLGSDVFRVYRVELAPEGDLVILDYCLYDEDPFGYVWSEIGALVSVQDPGGTWTFRAGGGSIMRYGNVRCGQMSVPIERGQNAVRLRFNRYGGVLEFEVPIDWEGFQ